MSQLNVQRNVLLNPGPVTTTDSVKRALVVPDACPREQAFKTLLATVRRQLVRVVHGGDEYAAVLFAGAGTAALEAAIASLVQEGRSVLVLSNGGYGERMIEMARAYGLPVIPYTLPWGRPFDLSAVESLLRDDQDGQDRKDRISHLAVVHHETTTGMLNPIEPCTALAHRYGAEVIVDAMSTYAGLPIDVRRSGIDCLVASSSKCVQAMAGLSFVIGRRSSLERCAVPPRSYYLDLHAQYRLFEDTAAMRFTAPVQLVHALHRALEEYFEESEQGRWRRYTDNYSKLIRGLEEMGFRIELREEERSRLTTAVVEPTHPRYRFETLCRTLRARGFTIYPEKEAEERAFRLANIGQIDRADVRAFLAALEQCLAEMGVAGRLYEEG